MPAQIGKQKGEKNMGIWELLILAVGLAMDAFAVSLCKGLSLRKLNLRHMVIVGLWFGAFQALMPLLGYVLGSAFTQLVQALDHWIAFVLLLIIGGNMIREAFSGDEEEVSPSLAVGITFAFLRVNIWLAVAIIGVCTFVISAAGVKIGNVFGARFKSKAELLGGVVLVLIGAKILLEHLGLLAL